MDYDYSKPCHFTCTSLSPNIGVEIFVSSLDDDGYVGFYTMVNDKRVNYIKFKRGELKEWLTQVRDRIEPSFKFWNLFKRDFYIRPPLPKEVNATNRSRTFTFDEESLRELFKMEKWIYEYIKGIRSCFKKSGSSVCE